MFSISCWCSVEPQYDEVLFQRRAEECVQELVNISSLNIKHTCIYTYIYICICTHICTSIFYKRQEISHVYFSIDISTQVSRGVAMETAGPLARRPPSRPLQPTQQDIQSHRCIWSVQILSAVKPVKHQGSTRLLLRTLWYDWLWPHKVRNTQTRTVEMMNENQFDLVWYESQCLAVSTPSFSCPLYSCRTDAASKLKHLRSGGWLSRRTVALKVQFTLFSPAPNLFTSVTMLAEQSPTGVLMSSANVQSVRVFPTAAMSGCVVMVCQVKHDHNP